ncbi:MAG: DnaJ domain-containing protein [Paludibacteraceae bacterium]|nr:DnaJ domain-containing protein [Paludibacteraceae bacterium]
MKNLSDSEFVEKYKSIEHKSYGEIGYLCFFSFVGVLIVYIYSVKFFDLKLYERNGAIVSSAFFMLFIGLVGWIIHSTLNEKNRRIQETLGMTQEKAARYYYTIINNVIELRCMPLVRQVCMLNPEAKESQTQMMKGWYGMDPSRIEYIYEEKHGDSESLRLAAYMNLWRKSMPYRKFFVEKLFKLAIVDDGIHIDEWNLLMDIMKQLKFNKNYFDFFIKRYGPLRTEFDDDDPRNASSTREIPVSQLKAYFAILGLEEGASDVEIKKAYHNLALQHHPDLPKNADRVEECEELMARINEAYEKIRN